MEYFLRIFINAEGWQWIQILEKGEEILLRSLLRKDYELMQRVRSQVSGIHSWASDYLRISMD